MDLEREKQVNDLLAQALDQPTEARRQFLETACDDPTLRSEVWSLLGLDGDLSGFLQQPSLLQQPLARGLDETEALDPASFLDDDKPQTIGPFRLLEILGEGGMGRVYLAEQSQPVRRRVALKLMRSSLASDQARLRFEAESQALARLGHPNVAQMFEAATTAEGRPYIAMEYVEGPAITTYCDEHRLTLDQRLDLFLAICQGVQHAHQKQLLHRDLKPSNILVAEVDGKPVPKIIDFGVVKALDRPLVDATLATGRRILGTPAYMSPEAIRGLGGSGDLDTRSDVYALGVVLYELMTGIRPYDTGTEPLGQVLRRITETEPKRPSTRVSSLDLEQGQAIAGQRRIDWSMLRRRLRGDLDSVVMKAIARDRDDRYDSAAELAADLVRYREDQPINARPASGLYTARKLIRRHRWAVAGLATVVAALMLAVGGLWVGLDRARAAEQAAVEEAVKTEAALDEAQALANFLLGLFQRTSPYDASSEPKPPEQLTALDLLSRGAAQAAVELEDQPVVRARIHEAIGVSLKELGFREPSKEQLEVALELRRATLGEVDLQVAETHNYLGQMALTDYDSEAGRRHFGAALGILEQLRERQRPEGEDSPTERLDRERLTSLDGLGRIARREGDYQEAERRHQEVLALSRQLDWPDQTVVAKALTNLAVVYSYLDRPEQAEPLYREALELFAQHVPEGHAVVIQLTTNLASALNGQGRHQEALSTVEGILPTAQQSLDATHPLMAALLLEQGSALRPLGRLAESAEVVERGLAIQRQVLGPRNPKVVSALDSLAHTLMLQGSLDAAGALLDEGLKIRRQQFGDEHPEVANSLHQLGALASERERFEVARDYFTRALAIREAHLDPASPKLAATRAALKGLADGPG